MKNWLISVVVVAAVVGVAYSLSDTAATQGGEGYTASRNADGLPDLSGFWQAISTAEYDILAHSPEWQVPAGLGIVEGDEIPYLPEALAKKQENAENWLTRDPEVKCYLPGVPRAMYMPFPFQIFQSDRKFFIAYEYAGATREVYLKDPGPPQTDSWMGQSVGRWEGNTFVVEVTGFNDATWFDRAGNHHTEELKVVERYTMTGPDHIRYEEVVDPTLSDGTDNHAAILLHDVVPGGTGYLAEIAQPDRLRDMLAGECRPGLCSCA